MQLESREISIAGRQSSWVGISAISERFNGSGRMSFESSPVPGCALAPTASYFMPATIFLPVSICGGAAGHFQTEIGKALCAYFKVRNIQRQTLHSDRRHGIGGAYPRFLVGRHAVIAVDPDESSTVINGLMRSALLWRRLVGRPVAAVVPCGHRHCIVARLRILPEVRRSIQWLQWDGQNIERLGRLRDRARNFRASVSGRLRR